MNLRKLSQSVYKIEESDNTSEGDIIAATSRALYAVNELINILDGEEPEDPINTMCTAVNNYVRELKGLQESGNAAYYKIPRDLIQFAETGEEDIKKYTQMKYDEIKASNDAFNERQSYMSQLKDDINAMIDADRENDKRDHK